MAPLPVTDQEYAFIPAGPRNWLVERGHTNDGPVIEHTGSGATVSRMSLVSMQPSVWIAVKRRVAVAEKTRAVIVKLLVESIVAVPLRTLQEVEAIARRPGVARPCKGNA